MSGNYEDTFARIGWQLGIGARQARRLFHCGSLAWIERGSVYGERVVRAEVGSLDHYKVTVHDPARLAAKRANGRKGGRPITNPSSGSAF